LAAPLRSLVATKSQNAKIAKSCPENIETVTLKIDTPVSPPLQMSIKMDAIKKVGKYVGKSVAGKVINSAYKYGYSRLKHWR